MITGVIRNQNLESNSDPISSLWEKMADYHRKITAVPAEYVGEVVLLKRSLEKLKTEIEELQKSIYWVSKEQMEKFNKQVIEQCYLPLKSYWDEVPTKLFHMIEKENKQTREEAVQFFRDQMKDLIYQSPFAHRTVSRPRGYPGDFEMMTMIYRNADLGSNLFAKCIEHSLLLCPEPTAVRNRPDFILKFINELVKDKPNQKLSLLSVGSGPAEEVQRLVEVLPQHQLSRLQFTLVDQDNDSLQFAISAIQEKARNSGKSIEVRLVQQNVKDVIKKGVAGEFDFIYCVGLFDYFSDLLSKATAKRLLHSLKPGGKLIIGNFDVSTPNRYGMSLVFDWDLIYRSPDDLKRIFSFDGITLEVEKK